MCTCHNFGMYTGAAAFINQNCVNCNAVYATTNNTAAEHAVAVPSRGAGNAMALWWRHNQYAYHGRPANT